MLNKPLHHVLSYLQQLESTLADDNWTDAQVLERFAIHQEEAAFRVLLQRHGPMVLAVCRRILHDAHAAEDAFQATFLVLARKASSVRQKTSLGSWLYRVASHIAMNERARAAKQRVREREGAEMSGGNEPPDTAAGELRRVLDEELNRLPEKYRSPLVLCFLEGKTHEEAARELRWPIGSMSRRLDRAKVLLQARLVRRGLALSSAALVQTVAAETASAAVPATLLNATAKVSVSVAAGQGATAGLASARVAAMADEAIRATASVKLKVASVLLLLTFGLVSAGAAALWQQGRPVSPINLPANPASLLATVPANATIKLFLMAGQGNMEGVVAIRPEGLADKGAAFAPEDLWPGPEVQPGDREILLSGFSYNPAVSFKWLTLADRHPDHRFGPEIGFARAIQAAMPGQKIAIFKYAVGDSNTRDWSRADHSDEYWKTGYQLYPKFLQHLEESIAELKTQGNTVEVAGLIWAQGEDPFAVYDVYLWKQNKDDPGAWAFARATKQFITDLRADVGNLVNKDHSPANFPVVLSRISKAQMAEPLMQAATAITGKPVADHVAIVEHRRREQVYITEQLNPDRIIFWVDTDQLRTYPTELGQRALRCRFLPTSYMIAGQAYAKAYLERSNVEQVNAHR
jgi:RNA polymerase sigma factor (sigma-70 family)